MHNLNLEDFKETQWEDLQDLIDVLNERGLPSDWESNFKNNEVTFAFDPKLGFVHLVDGDGNILALNEAGNLEEFFVLPSGNADFKNIILSDYDNGDITYEDDVKFIENILK